MTESPSGKPPAREMASMNDRARRKLCELINRYGQAVLEDPRRLKALLSDVCPGLNRQVHVLVSAAEQRVPQDILSSHSEQPQDLLSVRLARRLTDETGITEEAARWAVESWVIALDRTRFPDVPSESPSQPPPVRSGLQQQVTTSICPDCGQPIQYIADMVWGRFSCPHCGADLIYDRRPTSTTPLPLPNNRVDIPSADTGRIDCTARSTPNSPERAPDNSVSPAIRILAVCLGWAILAASCLTVWFLLRDSKVP